MPCNSGWSEMLAVGVSAEILQVTASDRVAGKSFRCRRQLEKGGVPEDVRHNRKDSKNGARC